MLVTFDLAEVIQLSLDLLAPIAARMPTERESRVRLARTAGSTRLFHGVHLLAKESGGSLAPPGLSGGVSRLYSGCTTTARKSITVVQTVVQMRKQEKRDQKNA